MNPNTLAKWSYFRLCISKEGVLLPPATGQTAECTYFVFLKMLNTWNAQAEGFARCGHPVFMYWSDSSNFERLG